MGSGLLSVLRLEPTAGSGQLQSSANDCFWKDNLPRSQWLLDYRRLTCILALELNPIRKRTRNV